MDETTKPDQGPPAAKPDKSGKKRKKRKAKGAAAPEGKRRRSETPFPPVPFSSVLNLADTIQKHAAGQPMRRLTIFEKLEKSPESSASRQLITNSVRYGITVGSYKAEMIELTPLGKIATSPDETDARRLEAKFKLAVEAIPAFKFLYTKNKSNRLPSPEVLRDSLGEAEITEEHRKLCIDVFSENVTYLGMLKTVAGALRVIPIDQALEELGQRGGLTLPELSTAVPGLPEQQAKRTEKDWKKVCFVIAPIDLDGSEQRKHSDMVLESLIRRALEQEDYKIVRADQITTPGMISAQVIEHLLHAGLVIADMSFHNPNVFYELAVRHLRGLPTVHLIRAGDAIPFDLKDFRTITIDTQDKYDLVAKLETYRAAIANHVRGAMQGGAESENPLRTYAKGLTVSVG